MKSEFLSHYQDVHGVPLRSRHVRRDPAAQPARRRDRAAVQPAGRVPAAARAARAHGRDRPPPAAAALRARDAGALGPHARRRPAPAPSAARSSSWPTRSPPSPSRRSAARRSSCSRRPAGACGSRAPAAAGARASPRACSTRRAAWPPRWPGGSRPTPSAACRSSAASRPACSRCARSTSSLLPGRPARAGRRRRRRGSSRSCWSRRSTTARCELDPASPVSGRPIVFHGHCHQKALAGTAATVALLRADPRRRGRRARRRLLRDGGLVRLRGRALRAVDADRRVAAVPGAAGGAPAARWSRRPACPAASRSATASGGGRWHPVELVRAALAA